MSGRAREYPAQLGTSGQERPVMTPDEPWYPALHLFGEVASLPTAWRVIAAITPQRSASLREARRQARERAWANGAAPERVTLDFDATLVTSHSEKERAAGNFKGGFAFHPLV